MWTATFDDFFFITLAGLVLGAFKYTVDFCLKSKCVELNLCNCIKIRRDVTTEARIEEHAMDTHFNPPTEDTTSVLDQYTANRASRSVSLPPSLAV